MAVGQEKAPDVMFFRKLNEDGGCGIAGTEKIKEIVSVKTQDVHMDMEEEPQDPFSKTDTVSSLDDDAFASRKISHDVAYAIVRVSIFSKKKKIKIK